jgi:aquaporin Z
MTTENTAPVVAADVPVQAPLSKRLLVEFVGTFWLVLGGCGSAVLAAGFPKVGIGLLGVSLAFGLTVLTMAFAFGHISGGHFNPAVSLGLWLGGRFSGRNLPAYWLAQVLGGVAGAGALYLIASGNPAYSLAENGLAANGYGAASPGGYALSAAFLTETLLTLLFVYIILGATDTRAAKGFGPLAIGLALTLIHLISIPVTNTSVNPARSLGPALIVGGVALQQVWLFWVAPLLGAALAGFSYRYLTGNTGAEPVAAEAQRISRAVTTVGEVTRR